MHSVVEQNPVLSLPQPRFNPHQEVTEIKMLPAKKTGNIWSYSLAKAVQMCVLLVVSWPLTDSVVSLQADEKLSYHLPQQHVAATRREQEIPV